MRLQMDRQLQNVHAPAWTCCKRMLRLKQRTGVATVGAAAAAAAQRTPSDTKSSTASAARCKCGLNQHHRDQGSGLGFSELSALYKGVQWCCWQRRSLAAFGRGSCAMVPSQNVPETVHFGMQVVAAVVTLQHPPGPALTAVLWRLTQPAERVSMTACQTAPLGCGCFPMISVNASFDSQSNPRISSKLTQGN